MKVRILILILQLLFYSTFTKDIPDTPADPRYHNLISADYPITNPPDNLTPLGGDNRSQSSIAGNSEAPSASLFAPTESFNSNGLSNYLRRRMNIYQNINEKVSKDIKSKVNLIGNLAIANADGSATGKNTLAEVYNRGTTTTSTSNSFGNVIASSKS